MTPWSSRRRTSASMPLISWVLMSTVEEGRGILAVVLDAIHRDVGVPAQHVVAAAVLGIKAHPDRCRSKYFRSIDEKQGPQPFQRELDVFRHLMLALDRMSNSRNSSPLIRASMSDSRKSNPSRFATSTSSASPIAWP